MRFLVVGLAVTMLSLTIRYSAKAADVEPLLARIKAVGKEGARNAEAGKAWKELVREGPDALLPILRGMKDADATAANWLRTAVDAIAERELRAGRPLPAKELEAFILEARHDPRARRVAYEWLSRVDAKAPARLLPGMLQDPSTELRRDAVAMVLQDAQKLFDEGDKAAATSAYRKALAGARDRDQVDLIAKQLKKLDVEVDLASHFGFIRTWMLIGPFDNVKGVGFDQAFPPEKKVDLAATHEGKDGAKLRWTEFTTKDPYGVVDLNKAIAKHMGATGYAFAVVHSKNEQAVQLRAGSNNAVKIFLNGKQVFFREEYHHGMHMDQHVGFGTLKPGRNELLIKVCQNEQTEEWAQLWSFQLRVSDAVGGAIPLVNAEGDRREPG